jgi:Helix-turn-helix of insertion element transposase
MYPLHGMHKQRLLDWLMTPPSERDPRQLQQLADELGVERRTLTRWKQDDREFIEEWEKRYLRTIGSPERKQTIMDTLFRTASDPDDPKHVQAAKQYMEIEGSMKPVRHQIEVTRNPIDLSDDELDQLLAERISAEKQRRAS